MHSKDPLFVDNNELKQNVWIALMLQQSVNATSIQCLSQRWKSVLVMKQTLWKNNLNFVKDVPMTYLNFIKILIVVFETK